MYVKVAYDNFIINEDMMMMLMYTTIAAASVWQFVLLRGPFFVGAPVRPNMLTMPKSASAGHPCALSSFCQCVTRCRLCWLSLSVSFDLHIVWISQDTTLR